VGETKRGRGRPRKANALTNAERQAAYRSRRKNAVTVTKKPGAFRGEVMHQDFGGLEDAMAELRAELDATKAELAEAHETIDDLTGQVNQMRFQLSQVGKQREMAEEERSKAFAAVDKLQAELAATRKADTVPAKAYAQLQLDVVALRTEREHLEARLAGIDNAPALNLVLSLMRQACSHLTDAQLYDLSYASAVADLAGCNVSVDQYRELVEILNPKAVAKKTVTRKRVTKKIA